MDSAGDQIIDWLLKHPEYRVDFLHKVGRKAIGFALSHPRHEGRPKIMVDLDSPGQLHQALDEARLQIDASPKSASAVLLEPPRSD